MASVLLINEPPLQVLPSLAVAIGLNEAIILQQIHYWLNPRFNQNHFEGRYWVYNTYEKWQQQFPFWCLKTIKRTISSLENSKVLLSVITRDFKKTKYYTIDYDLLNEISQSTTKTAENLDIPPSGQFDPIDRDTNLFPSGQNDPIDGDKMTRSYIDTETTQENTLPPLTPPVTQEGKKEEEEEEKNIPEMMVGIWNEHVQSKLNLPAISHISPKRQQALKSLFGEVFQDDLQAFSAYCQQIGTCRFLMGENPNRFRASLDWALNSENACKVLEGVFYDKPIAASPVSGDSSPEAFLNQLQQNTKDHPYQTIWLSISKALADKLGQSTYTSWFSKLRICDISETALTFGVDSTFTKDYIRSRYLTDLQEAVRMVNAAIKTLKFEVSSAPLSNPFPTSNSVKGTSPSWI
jgi:hypothetical protein